MSAWRTMMPVFVVALCVQVGNVMVAIPGATKAEQPAYEVEGLQPQAFVVHPPLMAATTASL